MTEVVDTPAEPTPAPAAAADNTDAAPTSPPPDVPAEAAATTAPADTSVTSNWTATMRRTFQTTNKYMRDKWTNVANLTANTTTAIGQWNVMPKFDPAAFSPLLIIALVTFVAVACSAVALSTSWWTCDASTGEHFGLWNTCFQSNAADMPLPSASGDSNTIIVKKNVHKHVLPDLASNETQIWSWSSTNNNASSTTAEPPSVSVTKCAEQTLGWVSTVLAEKVRVDHVTYSQGLLVSGAALYFFSWFAIMWAWWWMRGTQAGSAPTWLNSVRNILTFAVLAQVFSFLLQLVGFFLFIWTGRFSTSVVLLFFYFGIAIVSTNITNFITIEYKMFKQRHSA